MKHGWFGPRTIGLGFSPTNWKGWLAAAVCSIGFMGALTLLGNSLAGWSVALAVFAVFMVVVNRTYRPDVRTPF